MAHKQVDRLENIIAELIAKAADFGDGLQKE